MAQGAGGCRAGPRLGESGHPALSLHPRPRGMWGTGFPGSGVTLNPGWPCLSPGGRPSVPHTLHPGSSSTTQCSPSAPSQEMCPTQGELGRPVSPTLAACTETRAAHPPKLAHHILRVETSAQCPPPSLWVPFHTHKQGPSTPLHRGPCHLLCALHLGCPLTRPRVPLAGVNLSWVVVCLLIHPILPVTTSTQTHTHTNIHPPHPGVGIAPELHTVSLPRPGLGSLRSSVTLSPGLAFQGW